MKKLLSSIVSGIVIMSLSITAFAYDVSNTTIYLKWQDNGGASGFLGKATSNTKVTTDKLGLFNTFQGGTIYKKNSSDKAYLVYGAIYDKWRALGGESGFLGYPTIDETDTHYNGGRASRFEGGTIYYKWNASSAYAIQGKIRNLWSDLGWESSQLGYPTSDEFSVGERKVSRFENGNIYYNKNVNGTTWPMMNTAKYSQSYKGKAKIGVSFSYNTFGLDYVITGSGFTPNKPVYIYNSLKEFAHGFAYTKADSSGNFTLRSTNLTYLDCNYGNVQTVNNVITIFAKSDDDAEAAIYSSSIRSDYCRNVVLD